MKARVLKYCNSTFAWNATCNSESALAMSLTDVGNLLGTTINKSSECYNKSTSACGKGNTLIDIGGTYWLTGTCGNQYPMIWSSASQNFNADLSNTPRGLRPVIR